MNKFYLFFILVLLIVFSSCKSIMPTEVFFKDGTIIKGIVKLSNKKKNNYSLKFKSDRSHKDSKKEKLVPSEVDKIKFSYGSRNYIGWGTYRFIKIKGNLKPVLLKEQVEEKEIGFYSNFYTRTRGTGQFTREVLIKKYYIKQKGEEAIRFSLGFGEKKSIRKLLEFTNDCQEVKDKIENTNFNKYHEVSKVISHYNTQCK